MTCFVYSNFNGDDKVQCMDEQIEWKCAFRMYREQTRSVEFA